MVVLSCQRVYCHKVSNWFLITVIFWHIYKSFPCFSIFLDDLLCTVAVTEQILFCLTAPIIWIVPRTNFLLRSLQASSVGLAAILDAQCFRVETVTSKSSLREDALLILEPFMGQELRWNWTNIITVFTVCGGKLKLIFLRENNFRSLPYFLGCLLFTHLFVPWLAYSPLGRQRVGWGPDHACHNLPLEDSRVGNQRQGGSDLINDVRKLNLFSNYCLLLQVFSRPGQGQGLLYKHCCK